MKARSSRLCSTATVLQEGGGGWWGVRRRAGGGWRGSRATNCKSTSGWAKRVGGFSDRQMEGQRLAKTQLPAAAPQFSLHQLQAAQRAATLELPESFIMQPFRETTQKKIIHRQRETSRPQTQISRETCCRLTSNQRWRSGACTIHWSFKLAAGSVSIWLLQKKGGRRGGGTVMI